MSLRLSLITALASQAMASPSRGRQTAPLPTTPELSALKAFQLLINVTIDGTDFDDFPVDTLFLGTEHVGAGHTALVPISNASEAVTLGYSTNDTVQDSFGSSSVWDGLSVSAAPVAGDAYTYSVELVIGGRSEFGFDTASTGLNDGETDCVALRDGILPGTYAICDQGFDAPESPQYSLYWVQGGETWASGSQWYSVNNVPKNCVAVRLLPVCSLDTEFDGDEDVQTQLCYLNADSIDWSQQGRCG